MLERPSPCTPISYVDLNIIISTFRSKIFRCDVSIMLFYHYREKNIKTYQFGRAKLSFECWKILYFPTSCSRHVALSAPLATICTFISAGNCTATERNAKSRRMRKFDLLPPLFTAFPPCDFPEIDTNPNGEN